MKFSSSYKDKNDGTKVKTTVTVQISDLTKDLGHKFVFIDAEYKEPDRYVARETISMPAKDIPKLIKLLQRSMKAK